MDSKPLCNVPLLAIVGPTGSGKSRLAMRLALERDGEIISADSVQVYRHFDIGSSKPSLDDQQRVPHHLLDVLDPSEHMDASEFARRADAAIVDTVRRGRLPIVCGGTFLWVRALLYGLADAPAGDPKVRASHEAIAEREGRKALHERLRDVDPLSYARLAPNDFVRVSRALEVYELCGKPLSTLQAEHGFRHSRYRCTLLGVQHDSESLTELITERAGHMLAQGWLEEVRHLQALGYGTARAMGAVGYRQVFDACQGQAPINRAELLANIVRATRIFARRQRTWLRDEPVRWLQPNADPSDLGG